MKSTLLIVGTLAILFSGCSTFNVNKSESRLMSAKERAIIVVQKQGSNPQDSNKTIVCAEPSPDALSSYAMQLAAEGKIPESTAFNLAGSFQEGSAFIGLRTQSIQLLRDAMYRNCEAYANGAIDEAEYSIASRRHQRNMVALLAIEQLTGTVRVPPVTITTKGTSGVAKSQGENSDVNTTGETFVVVHSTDSNKSNDQQIQTITTAVVNIFKDINEADDFGQMCLTYLLKDRKTAIVCDKNDTIYCICLDHLRQSNYEKKLLNQEKKLHNEARESFNTYIKSSESNASKVAKMIQQVYNQQSCKNDDFITKGQMPTEPNGIRFGQ